MKIHNLLAAPVLAVGLIASAATPANASEIVKARCYAGGVMPDIRYIGSTRYVEGYAVLMCEDGYLIPGGREMTYLPERIITSGMAATIQSQEPDGTWRNRDYQDASSYREGSLKLEFLIRCQFAVSKNWRIVINSYSATADGRAIILSWQTRDDNTLVCG